MSTWTSLEIAQLAVSALTPLAVLGLGLLVARRTRRLEDQRWTNQLVVQRRVEIFGVVAPSLNQLLCFATFVGRWKELTPQQALACKRELDEVMYSNRPLFSPRLFDAYHHFMSVYFAMYATVDGDALLRVPVASRWGDRSKLEWWLDEMNALFSQDGRSSTESVKAAYDALQAAFRTDLYETTTSHSLP